jgi:hypothetical protein
VFAAFRGFAADALTGPDAKTPGILCGIICMYFLARRSWFWAGLFAALAVLGWQPLLIYPILGLVLPLALGGGDRWRSFGRAVAGTAFPFIVTFVYFAIAGAFSDFVSSTLIYPLRGTDHGHETVETRVKHIYVVITRFYQFSGSLMIAGGILLVLLAGYSFYVHRNELRAAWADPVVSVVLISGIVNLLYAFTDFQSYPDVYPFFIYGALGIGGGAAVTIRLLRSAPLRSTATVAGVVAAITLFGFSMSWFSNDPMTHRVLRQERATACGIEKLTRAGHPLYALGTPVPLVLTHRRNPDRYIYLDAGVDKWKIKHTHGGFGGWTAQIRAAHPSVVVVDGWTGKVMQRMVLWLRGRGFHRAYLGGTRIFVTNRVRAQASIRDVMLTPQPTKFAADLQGRELPTPPCAGA